NSSSQLGDGWSQTINVSPIRIVDRVSAASAGLYSTNYVLWDEQGRGSLWATGTNGNQQLNGNLSYSTLIPVRVIAADWAAVSTGANFHLGLGQDTTLTAWGQGGSTVANGFVVGNGAGSATADYDQDGLANSREWVL